MTVRRHERIGRGGNVRSYWIVDVQIKQRDGSVKRARRVPRQQTKAAAERLERELISLFSTGISNNPEDTLKPSAIKEKIAPSSPPTLTEPRTETKHEALTLAEFSGRFMQSYSRVQNKISEQMSKERILRIHLLPGLGNLSLEQVDTWAIDEYIASKRSTLASKTINNHLAVLGRML